MTDIHTICAFYATYYKDEYKQCIKDGRLLLAAFLVKYLSGEVDTKTEKISLKQRRTFGIKEENKVNLPTSFTV